MTPLHRHIEDMLDCEKYSRFEEISRRDLLRMAQLAIEENPDWVYDISPEKHAEMLVALRHDDDEYGDYLLRNAYIACTIDELQRQFREVKSNRDQVEMLRRARG